MHHHAPALEAAGLVKRYGAVTALAGIDLTAARGEVLGLLGPNGAGKTTVVEILTGMRAPTAGTARVLGLDPVRQRAEVRTRVAVQPQHAALFERQTVTETLRLWASLHTDPADPEEVIGRMGLTGSRDVRVNRLSGGQRQRLLVGTALVSRPLLLVLDEPSTGMDPNARQDLWAAVRGHRDRGGTVLLSTHSMEEAAALCDRVALLDRGRVAALGTPAELVSRYAPGHADRGVGFGLEQVFRDLTGRTLADADAEAPEEVR
ncbi:ABC transporter ATP-binding protein [Nocardiopsis ganjiahuensis]|uniref:ABC transporter ATP-binding protein n=1 Tax=Nocardiopsis ganjiahuensis TaxID=239984 RepID=UPI00034CF75B|nr:ABC transporter ATP-binding protein [Nocardiopsis ganjiahuensis]